MKIAVITTDGGAGKTSLSFALAKELEYYLISNDDSIIEMAYPDMAKIIKNPRIIEDTVYDFGGFVDAGVIDIIKHCDIVLVPCINDLNSKMKAIKTIQELSKYNDNFLVIATRTENKTDFLEVQEAINKKFEKITVIGLRKTKLLKNALETGESPFELISSDKTTKYHARNFIPEYKKILEHILDKTEYKNLLKEKLGE